MADMPNLPYVDMMKSLGRALSAHKAVTEGIATHVEKVHAERQAAYHKAELDAKLQEAGSQHGT